MAFSLRNLSVLAYANGFTLWHYKSGTDPLTRATAKGYFADAADLWIPTEAGRGFRFDVGHGSDLKPATIPI